MFSRLNEAVPLNAAEKRNAFGGPCPAAIREISDTSFFDKKLPFGNSRYRHYDLAAKFLYWEDQLRGSGSEDKSAKSDRHAPVRDVKKYRLDAFFRDMKSADGGGAFVVADKVAVNLRLALLVRTFVDSDSLLASIGMVSVYYLLAQKRASEGRGFPSRSTLMTFEEGRKLNRVADEDELGPGQ